MLTATPPFPPRPGSLWEGFWEVAPGSGVSGRKEEEKCTSLFSSLEAAGAGSGLIRGTGSGQARSCPAGLDMLTPVCCSKPGQ